MDDFEKWLEGEGVEKVEADIVKIDHKTKDHESEINALIFKLYDLNEEEIKIVFDSLKTPTIYQGKILDFFRKL
jgi:hypothetical protein